MSKRFSKTELGRQEIRERSHALGRTARNLLLILDGSRTGAEWLAMVQGASEADLEVLLAAGLIEAQGTAVVRGAAPEQDVLTAPSPTAPVLGFEALYSLLNAQVKEQLGLLKGYRFTLEVERAANMADLQDIATRLVEEIQRVKGDQAAQQARRAFGLPPA